MFAEMFRFLYNVRKFVKYSPYLFAREINTFEGRGKVGDSREALHVRGGGGGADETGAEGHYNQHLYSGSLGILHMQRAIYKGFAQKLKEIRLFFED